VKPINIPRRPVGFDREAIYDQAVWDWLQSLTPVPTPTVSVGWGSKGVRLTASAGGGNGTTCQLCVITQLYGGSENMAFDYIGVTPWDSQANQVSGSQFYCAKNITGRGPATELIDGQEILYSQYYNDVQRFAQNTVTLASEYQSIHTRYMNYPNAIPPGASLEQYQIYVVRTLNPTGVIDPNGNQIYYLEISPDRKWALNPSLNGN
jgi:hypothetical protein